MDILAQGHTKGQKDVIHVQFSWTFYPPKTSTPVKNQKLKNFSITLLSFRRKYGHKNTRYYMIKIVTLC